MLWRRLPKVGGEGGPPPQAISQVDIQESFVNLPQIGGEGGPGSGPKSLGRCIFLRKVWGQWVSLLTVCREALLSSIPVKLGCHALVRQAALFQDHWSGSPVKHCCKILSGTSPPCRIVHRCFVCHSRTALCTFKLSPHPIPGIRGPASAGAFSMPSSGSYSVCRGPA